MQRIQRKNNIKCHGVRFGSKRGIRPHINGLYSSGSCRLLEVLAITKDALKVDDSAEILTSSATKKFSRRAQLHGGSVSLQ